MKKDEWMVDEVLAESFPASDPPGWTAGIARGGPLPAASRQGGPDRDQANEPRSHEADTAIRPISSNDPLRSR
jgi:hypothetical protein